MQVITLYIFYERHWDSLSSNINASVGSNIALVIKRFYHYYPDAEYLDLFEDADRLSGMNFLFLPNQEIPSIKNFYLKSEYKNFATYLSKILAKPVVINAKKLKKKGKIIAYIKVPEGLMEVHIPSKKIANHTTYIFVMWVFGSGLLLVITSLILIKNQIRSIINLTSVARDFGKGKSPHHFKPTGAYEIRTAGVAFIQMSERIKKLIERKTQALADISHDIKTPLTRMNMEIEIFPDAINKETGRPNKELSLEAIQAFKESMKTDVKELENLIKEYLEYASSEIGPISNIQNIQEQINLFKFFKTIIYDFRNYNVNIVHNIPYTTIIYAIQVQIRRAFINIINNAISYASAINITVYEKKSSIIILIDDNGKGIKKEERQKVFEPFYKTDKSRNKSKYRGSGLGLAIAKEIILKNGGMIRLGENINSDSGLRVIIRFPRPK